MPQTRSLVPLVMLASVLGFAGIASAQSATVGERAQPTTATTAESLNDASSGMAGKREGKSVAVHAGLHIPALGLGASVGAGVHVTRDTLVEIDVIGSAVVLPPEGFLCVSPSVGGRHFLYGTGYYRGGLAYRHCVHEGRGSQFPGPPRYHRTKIVGDIGIAGAVGHRWQWGTFTLGVEWIGAYLPVVKVVSKEEIKYPAGWESVSANVPYRWMPEFRLLHVQVGFTL